MFRIWVLCVLFLSITVQAEILDPPNTAPKKPWYQTISNLLHKEPIAETNTWRLVTPTGLLLYYGYHPWVNNEANYLRSHNIADLPAWQGYLMASYAFKEAVTGEDADDKILLLANGLLQFYEVTGIRGLIGRSVIPDYDGLRLSWMAGPKELPTKHWRQGPNGQWWRTGVAKDHLNLAIFGCSIALSLDRRGHMSLRPDTKEKLLAFMLPLVRRLVNNNFQIIDWNGETTEYGDFRPQGLNGFNQLLVLHMMRSVAHYDRDIAKVYQKKVKWWGPTIAASFQLLGKISEKVVGSERGSVKKPSFSDMQAIGCAYTSLYFQEFRDRYMKHIKRGMTGLWHFMKYERNPMFTIPYVATIRPSEAAYMDDIVEDLRDFPLEKWDANTGRAVTNEVQPLANRYYDTNYWKENPYATIAHLPTPRTGEESIYASMDYLLAYWMGRYFDLVPET